MKSSMKRKYWIPSQQLVELVAGATQTIAESKGYLTYPKEAEVEMVLKALALVNMVIKEYQDGTRGNRGKGKEKSI